MLIMFPNNPEFMKQARKLSKQNAEALKPKIFYAFELLAGDVSCMGNTVQKVDRFTGSIQITWKTHAGRVIVSTHTEFEFFEGVKRS